MIFVLNNTPRMCSKCTYGEGCSLCLVCTVISAAVIRFLAQTGFHIIVRMSKSAFEGRGAISCCLLTLTGHLIRRGSSTNQVVATRNDLNKVWREPSLYLQDLQRQPNTSCPGSEEHLQLQRDQDAVWTEIVTKPSPLTLVFVTTQGGAWLAPRVPVLRWHFSPTGARNSNLKKYIQPCQK